MSRFLAFGFPLLVLAVLVLAVQTSGARANQDPGQCTSKSVQATVNCCERLFGNHPPSWMRQKHLSCAQVVICKTSLLPFSKLAFTPTCSIQPLMKGNDKGKGLKL
jgi:hypothetical protein